MDTETGRDIGNPREGGADDGGAARRRAGGGSEVRHLLGGLTGAGGNGGGLGRPGTLEASARWVGDATGVA